MVKTPKYKLFWDAEATAQLEDILAFLAKRSHIAPRIVKVAVFDRVKELQHMPFQAEPDELRRPTNNFFRAVVVFSYRITYQIVPEANEIRILRIRHTSREPLNY
ncbi:MAG: type II toxin-antitoxin system RelE/ParE family toxin [Sphingobacteriaceae bacterium]|nr:type II toxin-antitoxin system RelE/ParE family toxin [Sphingobacteriaceae bacterium]